MVRHILFEACAPDLSVIEAITKDTSSWTSDDMSFIIEKTLIVSWMEAMLSYRAWYNRVKFDYSVSIMDLLDPPAFPAFVFKPNAKDQLHKLNRYGRLFRAYDLVRLQQPPILIGLVGRG